MAGKKTPRTPPHVAGHLTFLVCVNDDAHSRVAARFAALRARNSEGRVAILHILPPPEFEHWVAVQDLMREERREEADKLLRDIAGEVQREVGVEPLLHLREGRIGEEILRLVDEDPTIDLLVVGAAPPSKPHGKLISWLAGQLAGNLHIPLVVVPGNLTDKQLEDLT